MLKYIQNLLAKNGSTIPDDELKILNQELLKFLHPRSRTLCELGVALDKTMPTGWGFGVNFITGMLEINTKDDNDCFLMHKVNQDFLNTQKSSDFSLSFLGKNEGRLYHVGQNLPNGGILCSVGYPFQPVQNCPATIAFEEAKKYIDIFSYTIHKDDLAQKYVSVVTSFDTFKGYWIEGNYALHAHARKKYRAVQDWSNDLFKKSEMSNLIITDDITYQQLPKSSRSDFEKRNIVDFIGEKRIIQEFCIDAADCVYVLKYGPSCKHISS